MTERQLKKILGAIIVGLIAMIILCTLDDLGYHPAEFGGHK